MSACIPTPMLMLLPAQRGRSTPALNGFSTGALRLSTDAVGIFTLRMINIVPNSRVRIEAAGNGSTVDEFVVADAEPQERVIPLYASGNPLNNLRIKVRNASGSPAYRPFETQTVAQRGTVSVFVFQEPDE